MSKKVVAIGIGVASVIAWYMSRRRRNLPLSKQEIYWLVLSRSICTQNEGNALQKLRDDVDGIQRALLPECTEPQHMTSTLYKKLLLCGATAPMFWMLGFANNGFHSCSKLYASCLCTDELTWILSLVDTCTPITQSHLCEFLPAQIKSAAQGKHTSLDTSQLLEWTNELQNQHLEVTSKSSIGTSNQDQHLFSRESHDNFPYPSSPSHRAGVLALVCDGIGQNAYASSRYEEAWLSHLQSYAISLHMGDTEDRRNKLVLQSRALDGLGRVARESGVYPLAFALHASAYQHALACRELETSAWIVDPCPLTAAANAISNAGVVSYRQGNMEESWQLHSVAKQTRAASGEKRGYSSSLGNLALIAKCQNRAGEALSLDEESLVIREQLGDVWGVAGSLRALAETHKALGNLQVAAHHIQKAVAVFTQVHDNLGVSECLETLALLLVELDKGQGAKQGLAHAATLFGAAVAVRQRIKADTNVVMYHAIAQQLSKSHETDWQHGLSLVTEDAAELVSGFQFSS